MRLLVIGASQGIGRDVVRTALDAGLTVRAFSRNADAIDISHPALETMSGDARNTDDVARALADVNAVALTLGVPLNTDTITRAVDLFSMATHVLVSAMRDRGVRRLIVVTGFGAGRCEARVSLLERLPFRAVMGRIYDDKTRQEDIVRDSALDWTIVRPTILTRGRARGTYKVMEAPESWRNGLISRADVADYVVKALNRPETIGADPVLAY